MGMVITITNLIDALLLEMAADIASLKDNDA